MNIREMLEKKMKEKQKKQRAKIVMRVTIGAIAGVATGIVGGVLMAPKSGKETREVIAKTAKDISDNAITKSAELKETLDNKVVETKNNATVAKEKINQYLADKKAKKNDIKNQTEVAIEEDKETKTIAKPKE